MRVFKFGGASVKDASAIQNVERIISLFPTDKLLVVVSAMGKTTNKLEELNHAFIKRDYELYNKISNDLYTFHFQIINELFPEKNYKLVQEIEQIFEGLKIRFHQHTSENYKYDYDQIVSLGEVISSLIVEAYLFDQQHRSFWIDARTVIRTNRCFGEGEVDWKRTSELLNEIVIPQLKTNRIGVIQGFLGHTFEGLTTTLGREGSDYTAGILAYVANAQDVTIWKDVPGMLNADPKWFDDTIKLDQISYKEAIELAYYGASVIHPKTIKPLQNQGIPLYVKSFVNPTDEGTIIQASEEFDALHPSFIFKMNQVLMSFSPKNFSFIAEENLGNILVELALKGVKINVMQNSALSFSILFDREKIDPAILVEVFSKTYDVDVEEGLELVTIRHYDQKTINRVVQDKTILLEQRTQETIRLVMYDKNELERIFETENSCVAEMYA